MLAELDDIKDDLGITGSGDDAKLTRWIDGVSEFIVGLIGRPIEEATYTEEVYNGTGEHKIFLRHIPLTDTETFVAQEGNDNFGGGAFDTVDNSEYVLYKEQGYVIFRFRTTKGFKNYKLTYSAGFATIPEDLQTLTRTLVSLIYNQRLSAGKASESIEGAEIDWLASSSGATNSKGLRNTMTAEQWETINKYAAHRVVDTAV